MNKTQLERSIAHHKECMADVQRQYAKTPPYKKIKLTDRDKGILLAQLEMLKLQIRRESTRLAKTIARQAQQIIDLV